jgi:hypothetical protein
LREAEHLAIHATASRIVLPGIEGKRLVYDPLLTAPVEISYPLLKEFRGA